MKRPARKTLVLVISILSIILITGCEEQNFSNTKKHRLIAIENTRLRAEITQLKKELELRDEKIQEQEELLEKNRQGKKHLRTKAVDELRSQMSDVVIDLGKENARLRKENEGLKAKIQQLEKELQQIKKPGPQPLSPNP